MHALIWGLKCLLGMLRCQGFIEKVDEIKFTKVKQRQLNKFNNLLNKKEGNITRVSSLTSSQNLFSSQAGRCSPSLWERKQFSGISGLSARQAGRHSPSLRGRKQFISFPGRQLISSPIPGRYSPFPQGRKQFSSISGLSGRQVGRCSPSLWGRKQCISFPGRQSGSHSPSTWGRKQFSSISGHSGRQLLTFP